MRRKKARRFWEGDSDESQDEPKGWALWSSVEIVTVRYGREETEKQTTAKGESDEDQDER